MRFEPQIEMWMAELHSGDHVITCPVVRGEILFGIGRLPEGRRRAELEKAGQRFLSAFHGETIPERAGDLYAALKPAREAQGLSPDENDLWAAATSRALGATLVSRDKDFAGIRDCKSDTVPTSLPSPCSGQTRPF